MLISWGVRCLQRIIPGTRKIHSFQECIFATLIWSRSLPSYERGWGLPPSAFSTIPDFLPIVTEGYSDHLKDSTWGLHLSSPTERRKGLQIPWALLPPPRPKAPARSKMASQKQVTKRCFRLERPQRRGSRKDAERSESPWTESRQSRPTAKFYFQSGIFVVASAF